MLKDSLYNIVLLSRGEHTIDAQIELNAKNPIFLGHFPGQPILPGACMVQIVKEVLAQVFQKVLRLRKADQIKFLKMIDPEINKTVNLKITYVTNGGSISVTALINVKEEIAFRLKGTFA